MKNKVNEFFGSVTPVRSDDEIIGNVLRKAENMKKNTRRFSMKKPMVAACAAVCILGVGVTAAAATGLIDFDKIFSRHISAENDTVAGQILANVDNVITEVSDENYNAELKAVISDSGTIIGCIEISRKDGAPISDGFVDPLPDMSDSSNYLIPNQWDGMALGTGYQDIWTGIASQAIEFVINDNGNLDVYFDLMKNYDPQLGKAVVTFDQVRCYNSNTNEYSLLLPINLWVQFSYEPSEASLVSRTISGTEQPFDLYSGSDDPIRSYVTESKFNCASASLTLKVEEPAQINMLIGNEIFRLIKDGEVVGKMQSYLTDFNGVLYDNSDPTVVYVTTAEGETTITFCCRYRDLNGNIAAFDISEIDAIEINGTIYPLA